MQETQRSWSVVWPGPLAEFRQVSMCHLSHWRGQQQHLLQWLQVQGAQEMQWAQALDKGPWLQMYTVPGNCTPLGWQTTEGSPSRTWQAGGSSFFLLPRRHALSSWWLWIFYHKTCVHRLEEVQGAATSSSFPATSLSRHVVVCTVLVCGAQCSMPVRLGHWQSQTSNLCSKMTGPVSPSDPMSYLDGLALRIWTSFWRREGSDGMDMWNAPMVQSRQPLTYRLRESMGLGGPRWHGSSWQRGIVERESSQLFYPHDRHTWRSAIGAASQEGGPLMWLLLLYLHINQKSVNDDDDDDDDEWQWRNRRNNKRAIMALYCSPEYHSIQGEDNLIRGTFLPNYFEIRP